MLPGGKSCIASIGDKSGRIIFFIISENKVLKTFSIQVGYTWLSKCAWADWKENGQENCKILSIYLLSHIFFYCFC